MDFGVAMSSPKRGGTRGADGDLVSTMAARLAKLEAFNLTLKKELAEKNVKIAHLEAKNS